jgi:predicted subunit of tRNA(5-methylaminomethyl-2-thiouridylate) methyltransferase
MDLKDEVSVEFSGGSDSTLAAAFGVERFEKVHLLTVTHDGIKNIERIEGQIKNLKIRYGEEKIVAFRTDIRYLLRRIYYDNYFRNLIHFGTHMAAFSCVACKMAMDVEAVVYNLKNRIRYISNGQQREKQIWPMQMESVIELMRNFFAEYGLVYECPVYDIKRTDEVLYEKRVTDVSNVKFRAIMRRDPESAFETATERSYQGSCYGATIPNIFLTGYFIPTWGQKRHMEKSKAYYREKLDLLRKLIGERLEA